MGQGVVFPPPAHERRYGRGLQSAKYRHAHVCHEGRRLQGPAIRHVQNGHGQRLPYHQGVARLPHRALEAHARQQDRPNGQTQAAQDQRGMGYRARKSRVQGRAALRGNVHGVQCRADGEYGKPRSRRGLQTYRARSRGRRHRQGIALPRNRDAERRGVLPARRRQDLRPTAQPVHERRILLPNATP